MHRKTDKKHQRWKRQKMSVEVKNDIIINNDGMNTEHWTLNGERCTVWARLTQSELRATSTAPQWQQGKNGKKEEKVKNKNLRFRIKEMEMV